MSANTSSTAAGPSTPLIVIETHPSLEDLDNNKDGLTAALKQRVDELVLAPKSDDIVVATLRVMAPLDLVFESLAEFVHYLRAGLRACHGEDTRVVSTKADYGDGDDPFVRIRRAGVLLAKLRLQVVKNEVEGNPSSAGQHLVMKEFIALEQAAEGSTVSLQSKPADMDTTTDRAVDTATGIVTETNLSKATNRKPAMVTYPDEGEDTEEEEEKEEGDDNHSDDEDTSDDEVIAVMRQRTRPFSGKRRTLASRRSGNFRRRIPIQEEGEEEDAENAEPKQSAGAAQKKRFEEQWKIMLGKLQVYKKEHGDCLVPKDYPLDQSLGKC
jgi:hypothetical protein